MKERQTLSKGRKDGGNEGGREERRKGGVDKRNNSI